MTHYIVICETGLHRRAYPTHEAATAEAEAHSRTHPDHSVIVEEEPNENETAVA